MNKPFILEVHRHSTVKGNVIRVNSEALKGLKEMQTATGLPLSEIASRAIVYAAENLEIREAK